MEQFNITQAIKDFMHPTVYTGVKPIFLVGEELVTDISVGHVTEAVWVGISSPTEFTYISKFAVSGKIILGKYYQAHEIEPFKGQLALVNDENLKNTVLHRHTLEQIKELEIKRYKLLDEIHKNFDDLKDLALENEEIYLFPKKDGKWDEELFSDFDINTPHKLLSVVIKDIDKFYGYFLGTLADVAGLKLRDESYLAGIVALKNDAKSIIKKIEWLELNDTCVVEVLEKLPKHPFEDYFAYVKKEDVRKVEVDTLLVDTLKKIILQHIPENDNPLGMEYIPIDKLLFLFHMIIPREKALRALEICDVVYEPPAIVLGFSGEHQMPPKYLVPIHHVANAYKQFPNFMSVCENFKDEETN
ncbi:hypothetical protein JHD49_06700 [Sulfurimonas sp. SAG-AH-194-C21]|nr:hypothetical protein [Sulfurimonas sp. SAG-AH-194-C21]MDF1883623.1 hypothetical protein [Sulfurimonas sp. SAG-AH-194-C21]